MMRGRRRWAAIGVALGAALLGVAQAEHRAVSGALFPPGHCPPVQRVRCRAVDEHWQLQERSFVAEAAWKATAPAAIEIQSRLASGSPRDDGARLRA